MKWLLYEEIQAFHPDIYADEKTVDLYDNAYVKTKTSSKIHSKVYVTESDMRSYRESMS